MAITSRISLKKQYIDMPTCQNFITRFHKSLLIGCIILIRSVELGELVHIGH